MRNKIYKIKFGYFDQRGGDYNKGVDYFWRDDFEGRLRPKIGRIIRPVHKVYLFWALE